MYQALYRKYRPTNFTEVSGQEVIIKTLKNEITHNKLSHAYLFTGPRGTGKTSIAKILAKTVNCQNPNGFLPCEQCVSCTQINNKQTTDIIEIDAASNNGVDEIRELKSKVNLVPSNSKYKIYIIDEVHMLTVGAFNALLKTLEEPPAHIIFILATTDPHKIPSTILSRCQRFDFKRISDTQIVERLKYIVEKEQIKISNEALFEIARLSDGGMRDSISMLDQVISYADDEISVSDVHEVNGTLSGEDIKKIIEDITTKNIEKVFLKFDECNDLGKNFIKLTEEIITFLRNLMVYKTVPNYFKENNQNIEIYTEIANKLTIQQITYYIKELNLALNDMKLSNKPKMILEIQLIKMLGDGNECKKIEQTKQIDRANKPYVDQKQVISSAPEQIKPDKIQNVENKMIIGTYPKMILKKDKKDEFEKLLERRINNALAGFTRKELQEFKKYEELLHTYLLNPEFSEFISLIFDGTLKAVGNKNVIYVFANNKLKDSFNESIPQIDKIITEIMKDTYHVVGTSTSAWEKIKEEFNNKTKIYEFKEEQEEISNFFEEIKAEEQDKMKKLFGDIVEYQ